MKAIIRIAFMLAIAGITLTAPLNKATAQVTVSFQVFYDQLSPYGHWVDYPNMGYVWIPTAGSGFIPYYTGGHWVLTEYGWTWVSDFPWGWAPFHYGSWNFDPVYGWIWIPGVQWGPAWVVWRKSPGYYGWVPMGKNIKNDNAEHWVFVKDHDIDKPDIRRYVVSKSTNTTIIKNSTVIENSRTDKDRHVTYNAGPEREEVQKATGKTVKQVPVENNDKPGQSMSNGQMRIYRPEVENNKEKEQRPSKVTDIKDVPQHSSENNATHPQQENQQKSKEKKQPKKPAQEKPKNDSPKEK